MGTMILGEGRAGKLRDNSRNGLLGFHGDRGDSRVADRGPASERRDKEKAS
jgi:hypothetical protein